MTDRDEVQPNADAEDWDDDWEISDEDLAYFKAELLRKRDEINQSLTRRFFDVVNDDEHMADELDQARKISEQAYIMRLTDKNQKLLKLVNRALAKFEEGEYGYCEGTGDLISRKRLMLRPWTRYSIAYKEELERTRGPKR